eukprot:12881388-Alexandrium_andersonii.AAC.1
MPRGKTQRYAGGRPSPRANPAVRRRQCAPPESRTHVCPDAAWHGCAAIPELRMTCELHGCTMGTGATGHVGAHGA